MKPVCVFDSGAGGAHVSQVLTEAGITNYLVTCPDLFPFGNKSERQLMELFFRVRLENEGTIYCACNTMSLVLARLNYDFDRYDVVPTFPQIYNGSPIYATALTCELVEITQRRDGILRQYRGICSIIHPVPDLVQTAEDLYRGLIDIGAARINWENTVSHYPMQMASTHLSYLAHQLGYAQDHHEPDYVELYQSRNQMELQ